jgi:tetrahydromethanopterin S-methyltransferase subunit F
MTKLLACLRGASIGLAIGFVFATFCLGLFAWWFMFTTWR